MYRNWPRTEEPESWHRTSCWRGGRTTSCPWGRWWGLLVPGARPPPSLWGDPLLWRVLSRSVSSKNKASKRSTKYFRNRRQWYKHNLKISRKPRKFRDKWAKPTIVFLRNQTELVIISELVPRTGVDQWPIENRVYQKVWPQKWESRFLQIFLVPNSGEVGLD